MKSQNLATKDANEARMKCVSYSCPIRVIRGVLLCLLFLTAPSSAESIAINTRFAAIDVFVDPHGKPLGAYQIEFKATASVVQLVGVEGGEPAAFKKAPYYDPKALQQSRIIVAAFSTDSTLPTSKTRVARLHVQIVGNVEPEYELKLVVAGDREAKPIDAAATYSVYRGDGN